MLVLRDYQKEALESVWDEMFESQFTLFTGSTGLGKTEILIGLIERAILASPTVKICFVVNKIKLLEQTQKRLDKVLTQKTSIYSGKTKSSTSNIIVGSIQSLVRMPPRKFDIIILDEAHNINQKTGQYAKFIKSATEFNPRSRVIACTATPFRSDGKIYGKDKWFPKICFEKGLLWSIENNFLVKPICKRVDKKFDTKNLKISLGDYDKKQLNELVEDKEKVISQVEDALPQLEGRKSVIWACISIKHAEAVTSILKAAGEQTSIVHSKLESEDLEWNMRFFEAGRHRHLVFVSIVSEGYDFPPIDAVVVMRPTRSAVLYVQTVGRGLRPYPGKKDCLMLDYGGVVENCGPLHDPYISKVKSSAKGVVEIRMKFCKECYEYCALKEKKCPSCEAPFKSEQVNIKNLTKSAYTGNVLGYTPFKVDKVQIDSFISKNGNKCVRIEYFTDNILADTVKEYFVVNKKWAMDRLAIKLALLKIPKNNEVSAIPTVYKNIDAEIEIYKKEGYWRVK